MTAVVVVGPRTISGPGALDHDMPSAAINSIDDQLALVGDRVLPVAELWAEVLRSAMDAPCHGAVLICPSWWTASRVGLITEAAQAWTGPLVVRRRGAVHAPAPAVIEIGPDLVVIHTGGRPQAIARLSTDVLDTIVARVRGLDAVSVDVPEGSVRFGAELARALRRGGLEATTVDDHELVELAHARHGAKRGDVVSGRRRVTPRSAAMLAGTVAVVAALVVGAVGTERVDGPDVTWLVEGRIAVEVPVPWTVQRVTSGPGSARLQVMSPVDPSSVIHVTQSGLPAGETLDTTAETLRAALTGERDGVFVNFTAAGGRADRAAVTYREVRADRRIDWTVLLDGGVRIAIGCQGTAGRPGPNQECDRAIRSVHAVGRR